MSRLTPDRLVAARTLLRFSEQPGRIDRWLIEEGQELDSDQRRRARALLYGILRHRTRLTLALAPFLSKPLLSQRKAPQLALLVGAAELLLLDGVPDRAAVDQAAELCRALGGKGQVGFVNAVLRRLADAGEPAGPSQLDDPLLWAEQRASHPRWIVDEFSALLGPAGAAALCAANQIEPATVLCVPDPAWRARLIEELGATPSPLTERALHLPAGLGRVDALPGFSEGAFWVQDEAAQLAAALLGAQPGMRVLDACAAPGGKSFWLAHAVGPDGEVVATDSDPRRVELLCTSQERLGLPQIQASVRDWEREPFGARHDDAPFDAVLLDAPCTGLGVIRRHPDIRWARRGGELKRYAQRQSALLASLAPALAPGGRFVYAVCTLSSAETLSVTEGACALGLEPVPVGALLPSLPADVIADGALRTLPHLHGTDGFFAAAFTRSESE